MKRLTVVSGICASFLLGAAMTAVAQDQDEHRNDKNDKQENARPENRQEQARPQEQSRPEDRRNREPQSGDRKNTTPQSEGRPSQEPQSGDRHPQNRENDRQMQDRQQQRQQEDRQQQQPRQGGNETGRAERRGGNQRRIPDSDFHAHFGRGHHFAPGRMQVYNGQPQFYYSGYTFALIQAWPDDWSYDADDYYIDEFDGEYWLLSVEHPGVRLELIIVQWAQNHSPLRTLRLTKENLPRGPLCPSWWKGGLSSNDGVIPLLPSLRRARTWPFR